MMGTPLPAAPQTALRRTLRTTPRPKLRGESGAVLIVALIMLILLTMLAVTSVNLNSGSMLAIGNQQNRAEAIAAANEAIEEVISSKRFIENPSAVFVTPCGGTANTKCVDVNGDGTNDVTVTITPAPTCVRSRVYLNSEFSAAATTSAGTDTTNATGCILVGEAQFGLSGASTNDSNCGNTLWQVSAQAVDAGTGASVTVTKGVAAMVAKADLDSACP